MARKRRKDGRVQVQIDIGLSPDGKRIRKYFYGQTLAEARANRDAWLDSRNGKSLDSVSAWADTWLNTYNTRLRDSTMRRMTCTVGQIKRHFDGKMLAEVTPVDVQAFVNQFAGCTHMCAEHKLYVVRQIFSTAVDNRMIDSSPVRGIQLPKTTKIKGHRALTREEQQKIISHYHATGDGAMAMMFMFTGMRAGELCALTWDDIDLDAGTISISKQCDFRGHITAPKTDNSVRIVPVMGALRDVLAHMHTHKGLLFPTDKGNLYTETIFNKAWHKYATAVEVDCTPHDLRDTYATILYDAGVDMKTMQALMGHGDISTTLQVYTKLSEQKKDDSLQKLREYVTANLTATPTVTCTSSPALTSEE